MQGLYSLSLSGNTLGMDFFDWKLFASAAGLACLYEALPYLLFPERMQRVMARMANEDPHKLRQFGLTALGFGVLILWLALG